MKVKPDSFIIISPGFPENENDTTCLPLQQQFVLELKKQFPDLQVVVLALQYPYNKGGYTWHNIEVKSFDGRNRGGIARLLLRRKVFLELSSLNNSTSILGVFSFWLGESALIGHRFAKTHGLSHRCWILGQDAKKGNSYVKFFSHSENELLALSDFIREEVSGNYNLQPSLVYPGVNPGQFKEVPVARNIDIIAAGSLIPLKRFELVIEIVRKLKTSLPDLKAVIAGGGPMRSQLEEKISEYELTSNIRLVGEVPHNEVIKLMKQSKLLLHPSAYEGFGMVCLEALAAGCRVISLTAPLKRALPGWTYVKSADEMTTESLKILGSAIPDQKSEIPLTIGDCVLNIMNEFIQVEVKA